MATEPTQQGQIMAWSETEFWQPELVWREGAAVFAIAAFHAVQYQSDAFRQSHMVFPAEVQASVSSRQAEYLAGRLLVRYLQQHCGLAVLPLLAGADRCPRWPPGQIGSLSHSDGLVFAALQPAGLAGQSVLGVDIECALSQQQQQLLGTEILSAPELSLGLAAGLTENAVLTLGFSAKESLYKALYPQCRRVMDFSAAELVVITEQHFALRLTQPWSERWRQGGLFRGRYFWRQHRLYTLVLSDDETDSADLMLART
ncbi:MAG: 4'-phosphopantetheinyl transferase superfamily protein [Rheinheimera sp.]|nr:MAG: 4'-phosphopantetheinyl transferase superfamily protein [Rheinheimera sp.]